MRGLAAVCAAVLLGASGVICTPDVSFAQTVIQEPELTPVYAEDLNEGVYPIEVESSSSMFRITEAELTAADGQMSVVMTMGGQGYLYVFMGTGEEAAEADPSLLIPFAETEEGTHQFTVPVEALNAETDCAAFSKRKEKWYDRTLVFDAYSLPEEALKEPLPERPKKRLAEAEETKEEAPEAPAAASVDLQDGVYLIEVEMEGGSGRASVKSPAVLHVSGGTAEAEIEWSSPNYDYMKIGSSRYEPLEGRETSVFQIPVCVFDAPMEVTADTTAMSRPHEIQYTLTFRSDRIRSEQGKKGPVLMAAAVILAAVILYVYSRKRSRRHEKQA